MQHLYRRGDVGWVVETGAHMFFGAGHAGVDRVIVHLQIVGYVAADHWSLHKVQVVQDIANARCIMQILNGAFTIVLTIGFNQMYGSTSGAIVHAGA